MNELMDQIKAIFENSGIGNVYTIFDPFLLKNRAERFILLSLRSYETLPFVCDKYWIHIPIKSELVITVAAPENSSADELYRFYDEKLADVVYQLSGTGSRPTAAGIAFDKEINRLTLKVSVKVLGMNDIRKETE